MNKLIALCLLIAGLLLAACGSGEFTVAQEPGVDTTDPAQNEDPATDDGVVQPDLAEGPVLVVSESGGCYMAGPNCRTIHFMADGKVVITSGEADSVSESTAIDPALTATWLEIASSTDFEALIERLPEGECQGCFDGIDLVLDLELQGRQITLDSQIVEFVPTEPFFAATNSLIEAVPFTLGEPPLSSDPTGWNTSIDPGVVVGGLTVEITAELPVVEFAGRALGGGLPDASINIGGADAEFVYVEIGRATGCALFEHFAVIPMAEPGSYQLFYDNDNVCEAFGVSGFRIPIADLTADADGTIVILDTSGNAATITLD